MQKKLYKKRDFYKKLAENADISTSQPSPFQVKEMWENALKTHDEVVYIPMSSGLSESCHNAIEFSKEYPNVTVVDNQRISVTQKDSVYEALKMAHDGYSAAEIKDYLENTKLDSSIYITVNTLKYLKKGGRITPAAAAIGTLLKIKPVLQIQGGKLDSFAKVMNEKVGRAKMIEAIKKDIETRFKEYEEKGELQLAVAYTNCKDKAEDFARQIREAIPNIEFTYVEPLSLSISCHIGSGALAVGVSRMVR